MKTTRVVNNSLQPQMLDSGVQLPAAGTPDARPKDVVLSKGDHERLVERGVVSVIEVEAGAPAAAQEVEPAPRRAQVRAKSE